jgi:solute carrier family 9 (sodium/hydrogen exchanger), member 6/7
MEKNLKAIINEDDLIQYEENEQRNRLHLVDCTNLLIFTGLLILVVLTIWFFKRRHISWIHETGLAIFYGAITGAIIRYGLSGTNDIDLHFTAENITIETLPGSILLNIQNVSQSFKYIFSEPLAINETEKSLKEFSEKVVFDTEIFFNFLLPPIIFQAGYNMKRVSVFNTFNVFLKV